MHVPAFARKLDWNLLWVFRAIVAAGGIGAAARAINRQQPSVSLSLRRLEEQLGTRLCVRHPHGIELTEAGRALDEQCRAMVASVAELPTAMRRASGPFQGCIAVHMVSDLVSPALDRAFAAFHRDNPAVDIRLTVAQWRHVLRAVERREATIGIACEDEPRPELHRRPLLLERQQLYCGRTHPLHGVRHPPPALLAQHAFVLIAGDEAPAVTRVRLALGLGARSAAEAETLTEARRLIALGLGLGFLPEMMVDAADDTLWPLLPNDLVPAYDMFVVVRRDLPATDPGTRFVEVLTSELSHRQEL
jgi:DNA-binding transcriptional LysR family regulator